MAAVVGVHGIGQQQLGRNQLLETWRPAFRDGLERANGSPPRPDPPLDIAYYGHLFLPSASGKAAEGTPSDDWSASLTAEEAQDLQASIEDLLGPQETAAAKADTTTWKAHTNFPWWLKWVDKTFGSAGAILFVGELRQVRHYLEDSSLKSKVDTIVKDTLGDSCRVLIGHSLGSVVAFEYVRQNPHRKLDLLLTLGSPLGLRMVQKLMPEATYGSKQGIPPSLHAWANVRDKNDPVACAGPLSHWWPHINDVPPVDNGKDAHSITAYLGKGATGRAILDALP